MDEKLNMGVNGWEKLKNFLTNKYQVLEIEEKNFYLLNNHYEPYLVNFEKFKSLPLQKVSNF